MNRLTDRKTAEALKHNCEGLIRAGIQPDRVYLEYIKLAEYENREEDREKVICSYDPDEWYE